MATYSVVAADGQMYGPADENTLTQWAREGRITGQTQLHSHDTGQRVWAQSVPSLAPVLGLSPSTVNAMLQRQAGYGATPVQALQYAGPMDAAIAGHSLTSFPVVATVLLTYCTFGIFPWIHFGLMHDKLPKVRANDPSAVKAILFHLIPLFNIYWLFFERLRLMDRIDEQRRIVGLHAT